MSNAGRVVPSSTLLKNLWGDDDALGGSDGVRVTIFRLRRKLETDPRRPTVLHTLPGVGVLLKFHLERPSPSRQGVESGDDGARQGPSSLMALLRAGPSNSGV